MEYKGAIFDMDGLLFDTERIYQQTWLEIAGEKGVELDGSFVKAVSDTNGSHMCRVIERYYHVSDGTKKDVYDFSAAVSGTEVRRGKPEPDMFPYAAERIGCTPDLCFVFEDSENGIKEGCAAGCTTIMVPDLMEASPDILSYCGKICRDL